MKHYRMSALAALFLFVSTAHAEDISITPGTGTIGFEPVTTVPEPNTAVLILIGTIVLCFLWLVLPLRKRHHNQSHLDRFADRAIYSNNPKVDPKVRRS